MQETMDHTTYSDFEMPSLEDDEYMEFESMKKSSLFFLNFKKIVDSHAESYGVFDALDNLYADTPIKLEQILDNYNDP